jgi:predicted RNase H-like HicB family nuclease
MPSEFRKFSVILELENDGGYSVHCPALPGCSSQGENRDHALEMIREAIELVLEVIEDRRRKGDTAVDGLPLADTQALLAHEVQEILEDRVAYGLPLAIEFSEVLVPFPIPV